MGMRDTGTDVWIEPARMVVRRKRRFNYSAVAADLCQASENFYVIDVGRSLSKQAHHAVVRPSKVGFQLSIDVMRQREVRINLECPIESILSLLEIFISVAAPFRHQPAT